MICIQYLLKHFTPQIQLCPDWLFKSNWYSWYPRTFHQQVLSKSKQKSETELYLSHLCHIKECMSKINIYSMQGCIFRLMCSHRELTKDRVHTSGYVKIFRIVTRNPANKSVWRKKDCSWLPFNKHAMNIWLSSLRIRAHLSWRTGKHLHVLHVLQTYSTCFHPRW